MADFHSYVRFSRRAPGELVNSFALAATLSALKGAEGGPDSDKSDADANEIKEEVAVSAIGKSSGDYMIQFFGRLSSYYGLIGIINMFHMAASQGFLEVDTLKIARKTGKVLEKDELFEIYGLDEPATVAVTNSVKQARTLAGAMGELPSSLLLSLVATYDSLIADYLRAVLKTSPNRIKNSKKTISYSEMFEINDIEKLLEQAIDDEIGSVLRDSHLAHVKYIEDLFSIKIEGKFDRLGNFLEIFERRNQYAHNSGIVSAHYIRKCASFGFKIDEVGEGDRLSVSPAYLRRAVDYLTEFGILTIFTAWKKSQPSELDVMLDKLNEVAFQMIKEGRFILAGRILDFALFKQSSGGSEMTRRMMCVNLANTYARRGKDEDAEAVLAKMDWSATSDDFLICVAAVRKNVKEVCDRLPAAVAARKINKSNLTEWPVFDNVRDDPLFGKTFEGIFGEAFHVEGISTVDKPFKLLPRPNETATGD